MLSNVINARIALINILLTCASLLACTAFLGQSLDSAFADVQISPGYCRQWPGGDLANRYGANNNLSLGVHYSFKSRSVVGFQQDFLFGSDVMPGAGFLQNLKVDDGSILDNDGQISQLIITQRGWCSALEGGYLFTFRKPNQHSGFLLKAGAIRLSHKIRIEHQQNKIAQLEGEYLKGYDRLCVGYGSRLSAGYQYMASNRLINFYLGVEWNYAITQPMRLVNFDTRFSDSGLRNDHLLGIRFCWTLHLYQRKSLSYDDIYLRN